jgi:predicted nucleic acid-binding protein
MVTDAILDTSVIIDLLRAFPPATTEDDNRWAMRQTASFHLSHGIQLQDAMIASVAARLAVPLYTTNLKHFLPLPSVDARKPY